MAHDPAKRGGRAVGGDGEGGAMTQDEWCAIKPNEFIECGEGPTLHRWEVYGVHIGAPGQESIVEMESKTHRSGVTGDWEFHPRVFVPIILLRACRRVPAEAGR